MGPSSGNDYPTGSAARPSAMREDTIEYGFIGALQGLKYEYRPDIHKGSNSKIKRNKNLSF